jgi:hypothetical protein
MNEHDKTQALKDVKRWHAADLKRIAELEDRLNTMGQSYVKTLKRTEQAEAELAALKGRRCDECDSREGQSHYCLLLSINTGDAFYCDFWTARVEEGAP